MAYIDNKVIPITAARTGITPSGYVYGGEPYGSIPFWRDEENSGGEGGGGVHLTEINITKDIANDQNIWTFTGVYSDGSTKSIGEIQSPAEAVVDAKLTTKDSDKSFYLLNNEISVDYDDGRHEVKGSFNTFKLAYTQWTNKGPKGSDYQIIINKTGVDGTNEADEFLIPVGVQTISLTNENGVYTLKSTNASGVETEIGTIEVPQVDISNLIAEVNDNVVEDTTNGFDFHTITETENNGTRNEVGQFYIAQKQVTKIGYDDVAKQISVNTVDQQGKTGTELWNIASGGGIETKIFRKQLSFSPYTFSLLNNGKKPSYIDISKVYGTVQIASTTGTFYYQFKDYNSSEVIAGNILFYNPHLIDNVVLFDRYNSFKNGLLQCSVATIRSKNYNLAIPFYIQFNCHYDYDTDELTINRVYGYPETGDFLINTYALRNNTSGFLVFPSVSFNSDNVLALPELIIRCIY